jgi:hypothetical protein
MKTLKKVPFYLLTVFAINSCTSPTDSNIKTDGPEVISFNVLPFELTDVKLLDGPFKHATDLNIKTLLNYQPDRLLAKFRIEAGLKPKAKPYEGWEGETLAGHSLGHYLSGCALMYQTTGDTVFLNRVDYIVNELNECQKADTSGYIGAVPGAKKVFEEEIVKGDIRSKGFDLNGIWAPLYTQHKEMAGLLDAYNLCGNKLALEVAEKFAGWMIGYTSKLNHDQLQEMMNCEIGGINESLVNLYAVTGEKKYLDLSNRFYHEAILQPLSEGKDILKGKHANTQIPKLIGLARIHELTNDTLDEKTARFFWERVVHHHSYVTGGHCDQEYFGPADSLRNRLSENTTETCNVYNMLKLSNHLFGWNASAEIADFYERALFNHILSSQNSVDGHVVYNLSLEMGGYKAFQDPEWFTCCIGTAMETHSKYAGSIYFHNNEELYVSQYIASELSWKEKGIKLTQNTKYPEEQSSSLTFECEKPVKVALKIRYPYWAKEDFSIVVNDKKIKIKEKPGSFVSIEREWKTGDKIDISMPFSLRTETMPDDSNRLAVLYGPLVLAGELGEIEDSSAYTAMYVPVLLLNNRDADSWLKSVENQSNTFETQNIGKPKDIVLKPFYKINNKRYSVYWDVFTEAEWDKYKDEYKAELEQKKKIEAMTIDFFQPGEMQPERDHKFKDDNSWIGELRGRKYREAPRWMSCELKTGGNKSVALIIDYWGGFPGSKTFDIIVDGQVVTRENASNLGAGKFISKQYVIPESLLSKKSKITVTFKPLDGHRTGPVFGVRTVKI